MERRLLPAIISLLIVAVFVAYLFLSLSANSEKYKGDFTRVFREDLVRIGETFDIGYNSFYISGVSEDHIYLGNFVAPSLLLTTNIALSDSQHTKLHIPIESSLKSSFRVKVDSPSIFIMDGATPSIMFGQITDNKMKDYVGSIPHFSLAVGVPLTKLSYVVRTYDETAKQNILTKVMQYPPYIKHAREILEKQIDGVFCTDGMLHYDPRSGSLVYVYFYRNKFILFDTALNIVYKRNTIDRTEIAKIEISNIKSEELSTFSSPPLLVNRNSCVSDRWILINSGLQALNEQSDTFELNSVVDVYSLKDGDYYFSFHLPQVDRGKIISMRVTGNKLIVLHDRYIQTYEINP